MFVLYIALTALLLIVTVCALHLLVNMYVFLSNYCSNIEFTVLFTIANGKWDITDRLNMNRQHFHNNVGKLLAQCWACFQSSKPSPTFWLSIYLLH